MPTRLVPTRHAERDHRGCSGAACRKTGCSWARPRGILGDQGVCGVYWGVGWPFPQQLGGDRWATFVGVAKGCGVLLGRQWRGTAR